MKTDQYFMDKAIAQAYRAFYLYEVLNGAVLFYGHGVIFGPGYNTLKKKGRN